MPWSFEYYWMLSPLTFVAVTSQLNCSIVNLLVFINKMLQQAEIYFCTCNRWRETKIKFYKNIAHKVQHCTKFNAFSIIGVIIMAHYFQLKLPLADITLPINTIFSLISQLQYRRRRVYVTSFCVTIFRHIKHNKPPTQQFHPVIRPFTSKFIYTHACMHYKHNEIFNQLPINIWNYCHLCWWLPFNNYTMTSCLI